MKVILVLAFLAVVLQATAASSTRAIRQYDVQIMGETPIRHLHRVEPGKKTTFNVHVPRDFSSTELLANLQLVSQHDGSLKLALKSIHDDSLEFEGEWIAPQREGVFDHHWLLNGGSKKRSATGVTSTLEVTCSNGVFCDGIERLVNGQCQKERSPCDDADDCTTDTCIEAFGGKCFNKAKTGCDICFSDCVADCSGRTCGEDGCGGFCGRCPSGQGCLDGVCLAATADGTCESPLPLLTTQGLANFFDTTHFVEGDTSQGIDVKVPVCNSLSGAQELIYTFTVPQVSESYVGIEAMMSGFDSVLQIFEDNCNGTVLQCSDDSSPPGNLGSRVVATLKPGKTYLLMADGYNLEQRGPFNLEIRFHKGCLPNCDGQFCGDDGCGGACGVCDGEEQCFKGSCIPDPCTPNCVSEDRECGDDGCGGTCGECTAANTYCLTDQREDGTVYFLGQCSDPFPSCNNLSPVCDGCTTSQFCGSDCTCYDLNAPLPDLVIDGEILSKEIYLEIASFSNSSCALSEGCVLGPGNRALLRFSVVSINQGLTDFFPPAPKTRPDLFVYGQCHRHYHFTKFSEYILKDTKGRQVTTGRKEAYCMEDSYQYIEGPQIQCLPAYDCGAQGIQRGWADIYGATLDCQWIDVTDIDSGEYDLTVKVNPSRIFTEKSFENNEVSFRIVIPDFDLSSLGILPIDVLAETSDSSNNNSPSSNNNSPNSPNSSNGSSGSSNGSSGSSDAGFLLPALVVFLGVFFLLF